MSKTIQKLTALNKKTGRLEVVNLYASNRTLREFFRMVLINSVSFVAFEILPNLVSMQNFLNANNC